MTHMATKEDLIAYFKKVIDENDSGWEIYIARSILVWFSHMKYWTESDQKLLSYLPTEIQMLLEDETDAFEVLCK